ncbi:hypothetical protein ACFQU1_05800 [Chelatococcus sp. GCM10030263]|uniref:hypothetical protein n=1 Tax=Chelatococcus sp. GCM10030263 TaxID=3273387 RepID=UPI00362403A3
MKIDWIGLRFLTPLALPLAANAAVTAWVVVTVQRALAASQCGIRLPWSAETTVELLQSLYPAAWREVETLRRLSSPCIASLHADVAAAFLVASLGAAVLVLLLLPLASAESLKRRAVGGKALRRGVLAAPLCFTLSIAMLYSVLYGNGIINFTYNRDRIRPIFDEIYINLWGYWSASIGYVGFFSELLILSVAYGLLMAKVFLSSREAA